MRIIAALAGDRELNAREEAILEKLRRERGEGLFSDMLYALTHKAFPSRQARTIWGEICRHREALSKQLQRDPGIAVSAHDFLTNKAGLLKSLSLIEEQKLHMLANGATHDGLTGLMDKKAFLNRLQEELSRQHRYGGLLSLVLLDIDHFKRLNDTHGHADGDAVLVQVADILREQTRTTDLPARYGGEEFAVLLIGVSQAGGLTFCERLRQRVASFFAETPYDCTISLGLAESLQTENASANDLIRRADKQLYHAKHNGRNRVSAEKNTGPQA